MKYKKRPVVIDAYPASELMELNRSDYDALPECIKEAYASAKLMFSFNGIEIETLEGWHHAEVADFIIRGVAGELYPCKPDIFALTYDPVNLTEEMEGGQL